MTYAMNARFGLYLCAAKLGSAGACYNLSLYYSEGFGSKKDESKCRHCLKLAVNGGHVSARHNLGVLEFEEDSMELATKHLMIAAAGHKNSMKGVGICHRQGWLC